MSAMDAWAKSSDLAANPAACTVAMWHRPVLTIGPHSNDEGSLKPIWRILYDNNVDLVLNGHEHSYAATLRSTARRTAWTTPGASGSSSLAPAVRA